MKKDKATADAELEKRIKELAKPPLEYKLSDKLRLKVVEGYGNNHLELIFDEGTTRFIGFMGDRHLIKQLNQAIEDKIINEVFNDNRNFELSEKMKILVIDGTDDFFEDVIPQIIFEGDLSLNGKEIHFQEWMDDIETIKKLHAAIKTIL